MLKYTPNPRSLAHYRSPDGQQINSAPFDPSANWSLIDTSTPQGAALYNEEFSRRYGNVPFSDGAHWHPLAASEYLIVVVAGLVPYAFAHGWVPSSGKLEGTGDLDPLSLYDFAYTAPEVRDGKWIEEWKTKRAADPGWQTPRQPKDTERPRTGTWPWYVDRVINGHGERFTDWGTAQGHEQELFNLCLTKLRAKQDAGVDIDAVSMNEAHWWVPQPSLLLKALADTQSADTKPSNGGVLSITYESLAEQIIAAKWSKLEMVKLANLLLSAVTAD